MDMLTALVAPFVGIFTILAAGTLAHILTQAAGIALGVYWGARWFSKWEDRQ